MYRALTHFTDLQDDNHKYLAGDEFPRKGLKVSDERLEELLTDKNRRHKPMIEEVKEESKAIEESVEEKPKTEVKKPATTKKTSNAASGRKKANAK